MSKELSFEQILTQWFDKDAIRLPSYQVGRINYGEGRSYIRLQDGKLEEPFRLYTSLTTAIRTCAPMDYGLLQWYTSLGMEEANRKAKLQAHYGTLMHKLFGEFLINGTFDLEDIQSHIEYYLSEENYYQPECKYWESNLQYDIIAFALFCQIHDVKPLAIEQVLLSERGYGTMIDLVCKLNMPVKGFHGEEYKTGERKGQPKESTVWLPKMAIINFKSGRKGFYREHGLQIIAEKELFEENYPDIKIDLALNWAPAEWEKEPNFKIKDWQDDITSEEVELVLKIADIRFAQKALEKEYVFVSGTVDRKKDVMGSVRVIGAKDYAWEKYATSFMPAGPSTLGNYDEDNEDTLPQVAENPDDLPF